MLRIFAVSLGATAVGLTAAAYYDGWHGLVIATILAVLEISLSFDNAIVNASILNDMDEKWRRRFLTWGILIAVFGMRLVFPIVLVAFAAHLGSLEVLQLALNNPEEYERHLVAAHPSIAAFGGMFLLMVFLGFFVNPERKLHWIKIIEHRLSQLGSLESMEVIAALLILVAIQTMIPEDQRLTVLVSGIVGLATYVIIHGIASYMNKKFMQENIGHHVKRVGITSFLYLEVLDASFSLDGVIGAFAITNQIVIIMIGLGIGAFFVRSMTIYLVERNTLQNYVFLEHGAHYALGALAIMMLASIKYHIPEIVIGTLGLVIILFSFRSSLRYLKRSLPDADKLPPH